MNWVDVCGAPGSGKSTLCDPLWGPHDIDWQGVEMLSPPLYPLIEVCNVLLSEVQEHPTVEAMYRMLMRTLRKMDVVINMLPLTEHPYIQTGFAQRGLGFGWRLHDLGKDVSMVSAYFEKMPVSLGVVLCDADDATLEGRNHDRAYVPATSHEDRAYMVAKMRPAMDVMHSTLTARGVPFHVIQTSRPVDECRKDLLWYASPKSRNHKPVGRRSQVEIVSALP